MDSPSNAERLSLHDRVREFDLCKGSDAYLAHYGESINNCVILPVRMKANQKWAVYNIGAGKFITKAVFTLEAAHLMVQMLKD